LGGQAGRLLGEKMKERPGKTSFLQCFTKKTGRERSWDKNVSAKLRKQLSTSRGHIDEKSLENEGFSPKREQKAQRAPRIEREDRENR
jgi:hypothetical protein